MEYVGKAVKKEFHGRGDCSGVVKSHDSSTGLFLVEYEGGDVEELSFSEVSLLIECQPHQMEARSYPGRRPKKRRRVVNICEIGDASGNVGESLVSSNVNEDQTLAMDLEVTVVCINDSESFNLKEEIQKDPEIVDGVGGVLKEGLEANRNLNINVNLSDGFESTTERGLKSGENFGGIGSDNGDLSRNGCFREGFDLNAGSSSNDWLNSNHGNGLHATPSSIDNLKRRGSIDLNLYANGDFDESLTEGGVNCSAVEIRKREWDFDLNVEVNGEQGDAIASNNGGGDISPLGMAKEGTDKVYEEKLEDEIIISNDELQNLTKVQLDIIEKLPEECNPTGEDLTFDASHRISDLNCANIEVHDGFSDAETQTNDGCQGISDGQCKRRVGRRKGRKVLNGLNTPDTVLRRSSRRGSVQMTVPNAFGEMSSPVVSVVAEEKQVAYDCEGSDTPVVAPVKLQLPPSSQNLNLDDVPILDLFSIYACLRSFSTLLFLSPFELDDFVAALKCKSPTLLFDCIHVSVLQTLRKHLEYLSTEGSESASCCLRSLNWDMLDLITWPIFMVEYLLIHGSRLKLGVDLCHLKLLKSDYYEQPTSVKIEILRCLCDDMIEVEAIRAEINRRTLAAEPEIFRDRSMKLDIYKKKMNSAEVSINSCSTEDIMDDTADWNSDECCLCKMDGSLICCDGCPAAYHLKCVGTAHDLLPEGDWFCPECAIDRHRPWMKTHKSLRGAELLGMDLHGRTYFSSCGYLLVSDSPDTESSYNYYHKDDLTVVIEALKSSYVSHSHVLDAICKHWNISFILNKASKSDSPCTTDDYSKFSSETAKFKDVLESQTSTEKLSPTSNLKYRNQNTQKHQLNNSKSCEFLNQDELPGKLVSEEDPSHTYSCIDGTLKCSIKSANLDHSSPTIIGKENGPEVENENGYSNLYCFAQTASLVAEELMRKSSEKDKIKEKSIMSEEEIIAAQMKVILKKTTSFCWPFLQNRNIATHKEKCGWCFPCKSSSDEFDCLFKENVGRIEEDLTVDVHSLQLKRKGQRHLKDVICQILSIEYRLQGLLLGPWLNSHYSTLWRESLLVFDLNSVKHSLLMLESNLHHLAMSAEWFKYVDSFINLGSASLFMTSSLRSTKHSISRKRARCSDIESNASSNASSGLSMFWWRGGQLSRRVFNWKVLSHSLVSKAARKAGCAKIPGMLYPEGSECAKRSRCNVWRAAVEASTSVEQLAFQVREFYSNIKWDNIENTHSLPSLEKESRKSIRLFKKVIVRRKSIEGGLVKYLLDFGKRRVLPDIVKKHGVKLEESSNERKRYWLSETYVPLHLLKNFEEKRIARKSNEVKPKNVDLVTVKSSRKKGLSYLFSKADRRDLYECSHCNKVVPIREAVSCRFCQGFFHKRHVRKYVESIKAKCTYTCHRCLEGISLKTDAKRGKVSEKGEKLHMAKHKKVSTDYRALRLKKRKRVSRAGRPVQGQNKTKVPSGIPLRRSARQAKYSSLQKKKQDKKAAGGIKKKKINCRKETPRKSKRVACLRRSRTMVYHSFWLNGLFLSRKPDDERVMCFREKNLLALPQDASVNLDKPKCNLCFETGYASFLNYIACEICGEWFHGDAFGLDPTKIDKLIGFRCHICRKRMPPDCPHQVIQKTDILENIEVLNDI